MIKTMSKFLRDENGATAIEYGLIAALVSVAGIPAFNQMGDAFGAVFGTVATEIDNATS